MRVTSTCTAPDRGASVRDWEGASVPYRTDLGRSGETLRQDEWRDELLKCGIRGKRKEETAYPLLARRDAIRHALAARQGG